MHAESPYVVGIVGGSCAGKTWLADQLQQRFGSSASRLSQDDFYHDRSHLPMGRRAKLNFDHPRSIDWSRLEEVLNHFVNGNEVSVPRYDFATHGRTEVENRLTPTQILLVEGLWLFTRPSLRRIFRLKIYIRASTHVCTERRLRRDTLERGRTSDQVLEQLHRHTLPMFERFVAPQEKWADAIVDAPIPEQAIQDLMNQIDLNLNSHSVGI